MVYLINGVENLRIKYYIMAIDNLIEPKKIIFASNVSKNRVCIYMNIKESVDKIISKHRIIYTEDNNI